MHRYRDICLHRVRILPELPLVPSHPPAGLGYTWHRSVLRQYDPTILLRELQKLVKSLPCYDEDEEEESVTSEDKRDPSYSLAVRLHLGDDVLQELLKLDAPIHRLQFELEYVRTHKYFDCASCGKKLADVADLIAVHNETSRIRWFEQYIFFIHYLIYIELLTNPLNLSEEKRNLTIKTL